MIYDFNHCAYKTAGYNCKFVYKTVSIQRSFVFASGTPTPIVVDLFGESTITVVNKYSAFRCKSGYSKGGVQRQNSPIQFTTRICALNGRKLILAKTMPCAVESFTVYAVHTIVDGYAASLSSLQSHVLTSLWSNSYAIREDGWNGARFQTTSTSLVRKNQLPVCFRAVLLYIRSCTHDVTRI